MKLAIIGDPVAHSRSPQLQRAFLTEARLHGTYEAITVPVGMGAAAIERLREEGYLGLNVTTPLKEEAFVCAQRHDPIAAASGSVNTIVFDDRITGFNTDGAGTIGILRDAGIDDLSKARVLVLGAGPTARSAVVALRAAGATVVIWNRTAARAKKIAGSLGARTFDPGDIVDAVFATLPPNAAPEEGAVVDVVRDAPIFIDANYGDRATLARAIGRTGLDGSAMLEYSARASFAIWRRAVSEAR